MKLKNLLPLLALVLFFGCQPNNAGGNGSPADQMVGTFVGMYQNSSTTDPAYSITVTKIADDEVQIAPTNGSISATFTAILTEASAGNVVSISLKAPGDLLENNGTFVAATGRLSYSYHLGGDNDRNLEVFVGDKQ